MVFSDSVDVETDFFGQDGFLDHFSQALRVAAVVAADGVRCGFYEGA